MNHTSAGQDITTLLPDVEFGRENITLSVPDLNQTLQLAQHLYDGLWDSGSESTLGRGWYTDNAIDRARYGVSYFMDAWTLHGTHSHQLPFAVSIGGTVVGVQAISGTDKLADTGELETWSWLARTHRGRGYATPMRHAVLHIGFHVLGADVMRTSATEHNVASQNVSRNCGYRCDGTETKTAHGYTDRFLRYRLDKGDWEQTDRPEVASVAAESLRDWVVMRAQHSLHNPNKQQ